MTMSSYTPSSSDDESDGGDPMVQPTKETALARTAMPSLLPVKEPRRKSGFDLFCASERARVGGPSGADAMKKLGAAWGKLSPKEKDEWKQRATHTNLAAGVATTHGSVVDRPPVTTPTPSSSVSAVATAKQATATVTNPKNGQAVDLPRVTTPAPNSSVNTVATAKQATAATVTNPKSVAVPKTLDPEHPALSSLNIEHVDKVMALVSTPSGKTWDQICGLDAICNEVKDVMSLSSGLPGILLFGLPGTGKSSIGEVVASQLGRTFFEVKPKALQATHIPALFAVARAMEPSVIFFEEANAMLQGDASGKKANPIATAIKADWQSGYKENVVIMAATNSPHQLESANLERFTGGKFLVPLPNPAARKQILERLLKAQRLRDGESWELDDKAWEVIKKRTGGYSGRDLALTLYPAALRGPQKDAQSEGLDAREAPLRAITFKDFKKAMKKHPVTPDAKLANAISKFNEEHGTKAEVSSSASDGEDSDDDVDSTKLRGREAGAGGSGTVRHDVQRAIAQEEDCAKQRAKAQAVASAAPRPMRIESVSDRTNQEEAFASDPEEDIPIKDILRKRHLRTQSNTKSVATEPKPDSEEDIPLTDRKRHLRTQSSAKPTAQDSEDDTPLQARKRTRTKKGSGTVRTAALMSAAAASGAMTVDNADEHERGLEYGANAPEKAAANMAAFAPAATVANASSDPSDLKGALQRIYKTKSNSCVLLHDVFDAIANEYPVVWEELPHPRRLNQGIDETQRRKALSNDPKEYSTLVNELFQSQIASAFPHAKFPRVNTSDGKKETVVIGITQKVHVQTHKLLRPTMDVYTHTFTHTDMHPHPCTSEQPAQHPHTSQA